MAKKVTKKAKTQKKQTPTKIAKKVVKKTVKKTAVPKAAKTAKSSTASKKRGRPKKDVAKVVKQYEETRANAPIIPSKPAYPKDVLDSFKKLILEKREEIVLQLESLRDRLVDHSTGQYVNENSPYSLHMAELGTDAMEKEKHYLFTQRETKFLGYLDEALKRISAGTYGYCVDCGSVIPKGRLEAVPHSQHCINCKTKFGK